MSKQLKVLNPQPFPKGDKNYIDKFSLTKDNVHHYLYHNAKGEIEFLVYIQDKEDGTKSVQQGSYNNGRYEKCNAWTQVKGYKKPLYDIHNLALTNKEILITEGEKKCLKARELFPNMFVTTYQGGRSGWKNSKVDFSVLKGRKVTVWPDLDNDGKGQEEFTDLARYLNKEFNVEASVVQLPNYTEFKNLYEESEGEEYPKKSFDLADTIPGVWKDTLYEFVSEAVIPKPLAEVEYSCIDNDLDRWIYIASSGVLYYDKQKNSYAKKEQLNNLYRRDPRLEGLATTHLQRNNIAHVDSQTFRPGSEFIFEEKGSRYLNKYRDPKFEKITGNVEYDISIWRNHLKILANQDETNLKTLEDIIASDLQHPEQNRTFAVILNSSQGVGKTVFFNGLQILYGESNCSDLNMKQLTGQYQPHMLDSCYLFVNEIDSSGIDDKGRRANLKTIISDEHHTVELKGVDLMKVNCHYTVWGATNETIPLYMAKGERRTFYLEVEATKQQIESDNPNYFKEFTDFTSSYDRMREVYDFYRYRYQVSKGFDRHHAPTTLAKEELIESSKPQYFKYLDRLQEDETLDCFKKDLFNIEKGFDEVVRYAIADDMNPLQKWKTNHIKRWVKDNELNFRVSTEGVKQPNGKRIRFWCVQNHQWWKQYRNNMDTIEAHLDNLIDTKKVSKITFAKQQEAYNG